MKYRLLALAASVFCAFSLTACNGVGPKESLLAKINDDAIYEDDMAYLLKGDQGKDKSAYDIGKLLYERLYSGSALMSKALAEYPDLEKEWEEMSRPLESRWLTLLFRGSYLDECMGASDAVLRQYYRNHASQFKVDSLIGYIGARRDVAGEYYISTHEADYADFMKKELAHFQEPSHNDSVTAKSNYLSTRRNELNKSYTDSILEKQHFAIAELPAVDAPKYYERHKDLFMTAPGYELYKIQNTDSVKLSEVPAESITEAAFKQVDSYYVGLVKVGYPLPYGIGMLPQLDDVLKDKAAGFVTPVLRGNNNVFYRFYLAAVVPSQVKPYDRVEKGLLNDIANGGLLDVDSSATLILHDGKPFFTEADLIKFNEQFVKRPITKRSHEWLTKMLADHFAFAEAARALKLDHDWEYKALVRSARIEFFTEKYVEKMMGKASDQEARAWFDRIVAKERPLAVYDSVRDQAKLLASFPENLIKRDYYMGYAVMYKARSYEQSYQSIYERRVGEYKENMKTRLLAEAYSAARIHLYNFDIPEYKPAVGASAALAFADSLYKAGKLDDAFLEYRTLLFVYPDVDSVFSKANYAMAEIRNETNQFLDAEEEYYAFYRTFPNHPNAEKAMFSRAFVLTENLHKDKLAEEVLEEFLKTYPNSEFKESAQWLLDNIRSNGKLQEELTKKISAEEKSEGNTTKK